MRFIHPKHGTHEPRRDVPARRPNSVRRTTTIDTTRPDGLLETAHLDGRARDMFTDASGISHVLGVADMRVRIGGGMGRVIESISVDPFAALDVLVGISASTGFRAALERAMPGERGLHTLRFQLLDDLPTAALVSGHALGAAGLFRTTPMERAPSDGIERVDLCAGWARDATILTEMAENGHPPNVTGPEATPLVDVRDSQSWHAFDPLPAHGMRRARRIDVWGEGGQFRVENYFRDSHMDPDGLETAVHEYTVQSVFDPVSKVFIESHATAHSLPWMECPQAAASAKRLVGVPADGLRKLVRTTFVGISTCTHLNDTLRLLEDVPGLIELLDARQAPVR